MKSVSGDGVGGNASGYARKDDSGFGEGYQYAKKSQSASPSAPALSNSSPTRSVHKESGMKAKNDKLLDTRMKGSKGPTHVKRLFEETSPQVARSEMAAAAAARAGSSNSAHVKETEKKVARGSNLAEDTKEPPKSQEDMEVDEINTGSNATAERRLSKRQRIVASHRYSPGEGGGLATKKSKANNDGRDAPLAKVGKDAVPETQPNPAAPTAPSTTEQARIRGGKLDGNEEMNDNTSRRVKGGNEILHQNSAPREWSEPTYRWIDEGVKSNIAPLSTVEHQGVEIDFTSSKTDNWTPPPPFVVRPGDVVLLSSGVAPWDDVKQQHQQNADQDMQPPQQKREVVPIYNDPASREAGLGALDPYIGYVERLWEEPEDLSKKVSGQKRKKGKNAASSKSVRSSRMMVRTRWLFKKENLAGLKGKFVVEGGTSRRNSKEAILASLASQDLVLTDRSDNNSISTVLGKIKVVKRKPLVDHSFDDEEMNDQKGTFVCRYDLSFVKSSGKGAMVVKLIPYGDEMDFGDSFIATTGSCANGSESNNDLDSSDPTPTSTDDDGYNSARDEKQDVNNNYAAAPLSSFPMSPRRLVAEGGTTVGKIKIGPNHQATIPEQLDLARKTSFRGLANPPSQRIPMMVWDPATNDKNAVNEFLEEATSLLCNHMKQAGIQPFLDANYVESPNAEAEAEKPREVNVDRLLTELHECKGNTGKAIKRISSNPEKYMTIWTSKDKEQFDTGYRTYRESIRMIANSLGNSKSCKDTVDYQYRFKLVENFRRFRMKRREKAEEIMATVEDRMLNEKVKADAKSQEAIETDISSSEEDEGKVSSIVHGKVGAGGRGAAVPATRDGPVNNRVRTWFRTGGGGDDSIGATQQRRNQACEVLSHVRERVSKDAYVALAKSIKACNSSHATGTSLSEVKTVAEEIMKNHPDLLERFITFLPKEVQSN